MLAFMRGTCALCLAQQAPEATRFPAGTLDGALAKLRSGEQALRDEAQRELAAAGRSALGGLKKALGEEETRTREAAAAALARMGSPAVKTLLAGLESDGPNCRRAAGRGLVMLMSDVRAGPGSAEAAEALLRMSRKGSPPLRQMAISIIGHICARPGICPAGLVSKGGDAFLAALDDDEADVRWVAAQGIGRLSGELAEERRELIAGKLQAALASSAPRLRGAAAWALHREDAAAASMDLDADATVACLALTLRESPTNTAPAVTEQIAKRGAAIAEDILALLAADIASGDAQPWIEALRAIGSPARDSLLGALGSPDAAIRAVAAQALSAAVSASDRDVAQALQSALQDGDGAVRLAAASTLGAAMGEPGALVSLLADRYDYVRAGAAEALVVMGETAVEPLVGALSSAQPDVRRVASVCLGRIEDVRAVRPLVGLLRDAEPPVRSAVADALGRLKSTTAVQPLVDALKDSAAGVRCQAAEALGIIGDARAVDPLIGALPDVSPAVRATAVAALGALGAPASGTGSSRAMEALLMAIRPESGICSPTDAAEALGRMSPAAVRPLLLLLRDNDPTVRRAAIHGIGLTGAVEAAEALVALLGDSDPRICEAAAAGILAFRDGGRDARGQGLEGAIEALGQGLSDKNRDIRARSAALLAQMVSGHDAPELRAEAARMLVSALADPSPLVRAAAATALGDLQDPSTVDVLRAALADASFDVRRAAGVALQRIRTPEALAALRSAGKEPPE
jgi:HEAT repeat protein